MAIPEKIKRVSRPKNTVIKDYFGKYKVVKRTSKYVNGKAIPKDLEIVGEIIDYKFVPYPEPIPVGTKTKETVISKIKDFGNIELITKYTKDILKELRNFFDTKVANFIYSLAVMKSINPEAIDDDFKLLYETSFLSEKFRNLNFDVRNLDKLILNYNSWYSQTEWFMNERIKKFRDTRNVVLASFKWFFTEENMFLNYEPSITWSKMKFLYIFDFITKEPIFHRPFVENIFNGRTFYDFFNSKDEFSNKFVIFDNEMEKDEIEKVLKNNQDIKYIKPLDVHAESFNIDELLSSSGWLAIHNYYKSNSAVSGLKINDNSKFIYAFRDFDEAIRMGRERLAMIDETYRYSDLLRDRKYDGITIVESNIDTHLEEIYMLYNSHPNVIQDLKFTKNLISSTERSANSVLHKAMSEFVNFLAKLIKFKIENILKEKEVDNEYSYKQIIKRLGYYRKQQSKEGNWISVEKPKEITKLAKIFNL
ncbi:hypothetical protein [Metamycoplasma alkalescens]|uniref:Uncharacterized protein n=3 Tax=Metamycoplasma alkalescens TaxID=45363 RepID=A0A318U541_9BACT|nr:hypothetical protein [Metamycoplasma alkalescens]PYF43057.1 hypothetical protein BCF88_10636 [Metamycoplasma alkalescens]